MKSTKTRIFLDADPNNYMSYYKRATVFLALSRPRPALADLDKVIQLKNDFMAVIKNVNKTGFTINFVYVSFQARVQRGSVLVKTGRLDEAHIELEKVVARDPGNDEANRLYISVGPLQKSVEEVYQFMQQRNYQPAIDRLTELVEVRSTGTAM